MVRRLRKSTAALLLLVFSYSQNLYAFGPAVSYPINPAPNALSQPQLPLETKQVTNSSYTNKGASLGVDPRLTNLIGTGVSGAINGSFQAGVETGSAIIDGITNGLLRGTTSLGIEYLTQKADLDPLLGSLTSRAITGAIEGALGGVGIFQGIYEGFKQSVLNIARLGISGDDPWSQAQYLQRVSNFSKIIQEDGLVKAIESTATQVLTEDSISSILKSFSTVGAFFKDQFDNNKAEIVPKAPEAPADEPVYKKVLLGDGNYQIFSVDEEGKPKDLIEVKRGDQVLRGAFGRDEQGNWGLMNGHSSEILSGGQEARMDIVDGNVALIEINDSLNGTLFEVSARDTGGRIRFNSEEMLQDAVITSRHGANTYIDIQDGQIRRLSLYEAADPFEFILPAGERDGFAFDIKQNDDGSYSATQNFGLGFRQIFANGLGEINPFVADGLKTALRAVSPMAYDGLEQGLQMEQAFTNRYNYFTQEAGFADNQAMAWALLDTAGDYIGYTPLLEGIYGVNTQTGELLTNDQRSVRMGLGALTLLGNIFGGAQALHSIGLVPKVGNIFGGATSTLSRFNTQLGEVGSAGDLSSRLTFRNGLPPGIRVMSDTELMKLGRTPFGFASTSEYSQFTNELKSGLAKVGASDAKPILQGSSTTGIRFKSGLPFDDPSLPRSDFDIAIADKNLFRAAKALDVDIRGGSRTMPLSADTPLQLERLGLASLRNKLSQLAGREVNFMIFESAEDAIKRGPSIRVD